MPIIAGLCLQDRQRIKRHNACMCHEMLSLSIASPILLHCSFCEFSLWQAFCNISYSRRSFDNRALHSCSNENFLCEWLAKPMVCRSCPPSLQSSDSMDMMFLASTSRPANSAACLVEAGMPFLSLSMAPKPPQRIMCSQRAHTLTLSSDACKPLIQVD